MRKRHRRKIASDAVSVEAMRLKECWCDGVMRSLPQDADVGSKCPEPAREVQVWWVSGLAMLDMLAVLPRLR